MLLFNAHPLSDTLRARFHTLSRAWRCCAAPEENGHSGSMHLALHDSGCVLGHFQSPDLA